MQIMNIMPQKANIDSIIVYVSNPSCEHIVKCSEVRDTGPFFDIHTQSRIIIHSSPATPESPDGKTEKQKCEISLSSMIATRSFPFFLHPGRR